MFWVNVPVGVYGTIWAYRRLRDNGERHRSPIDWGGNSIFAVGLGAILIGITEGLQPYAGHTMGWTNPLVLGLLGGGALLLVVFALIESRVAAPLFQRGGLQFKLIIWLQGIWLAPHAHRTGGGFPGTSRGSPGTSRGSPGTSRGFPPDRAWFPAARPRFPPAGPRRTPSGRPAAAAAGPALPRLTVACPVRRPVRR